MLVALLLQAAPARLPTPVVIALLAIVLANALALLVSLGIARRIRSIGETPAPRPDADADPPRDPGPR